MKSEILKLLTENIDKFHPLDFIIIFVISILAGLTCYARRVILTLSVNSNSGQDNLAFLHPSFI